MGYLQLSEYFLFLLRIVLVFVIKCSYVVPLANALQEEKWSLVQPLLSSSYIGYGTSSLKEVQASFGWNIFYIMGITRMFSLCGKK
jgi:hypothetical protein